MLDDRMDRLLAKHDEIVPSSGLTNAVMEAVRREAETPPPLAFPLWRALPGWVAVAIAMVLAFAGIVRGPRVPTMDGIVAPISSAVMAWLVIWAKGGGTWILLGLVVSFVAVKVSLSAVSGKR